MIGYAERDVFIADHLELFRKATELVKSLANLPVATQEEIRCHELARAVARMLDIEHRVQDGLCGVVNHSWISLIKQGDRFIRNQAILDVYVPGRLPQVQLIHYPNSVLEELRYKIKTLDITINDTMVALLVETMKNPQR